MQQVRLVDILNRLRVFAGAGGKRIQPHRPAVEFLDDGEQQVAVGLVEADFVDFQGVEGCPGYGPGDDAVGFDLRVVAHTFEQAVDDTGGAARAA